MKPNVEKEINILKQMVQNWYDFYLRCANGHEYDQIHVQEFQEVCDQQLSPYLQRLAQCEHIDKKELSDLYLFVATKAQGLSLEITAVKPKEKDDPVITLLKNLGLTEVQKKAAIDFLNVKI